MSPLVHAIRWLRLDRSVHAPPSSLHVVGLYIKAYIIRDFMSQHAFLKLPIVMQVLVRNIDQLTDKYSLSKGREQP